MKPLRIVHLYPQEMNIYGDTGNVVVLRRRLQWRGFRPEVIGLGIGDPLPTDADLVVFGGGQDTAQAAIAPDLRARGAELRAMADDGVVMLAICAAYQLFGHEFRTVAGVRLGGIGLFDHVTVGSENRLIGNHAVDSPWGRLVGYENHSGITTLGPSATPLAQTGPDRGNGDGTEGCVRDNAFGTYLHGPVLAKSPGLADELLRRAIDRRGGDIALAPLDDRLALRAAAVAAGRPR